MKGLIVQKINSEPGDGTPNGTFGKAIYKIDTPEGMKQQFPDVECMYGVVWDGDKIIVHCVSPKIEILDKVPVEIEPHEMVVSMYNTYKKVLPIKTFEEV